MIISRTEECYQQALEPVWEYGVAGALTNTLLHVERRWQSSS